MQSWIGFWYDKDMIRKWSIPDEQTQKQCVDEVIARIDAQDGAEFGMIAAQELIDIVSQYVGPVAYNLGIQDAKHVLQNKISDLEVELDILKQSH